MMPAFPYQLFFMDFEPSGLKDSIHSFNKYVLSDFYVPLKFGVLEIHTAVSKTVRHGVYITHSKGGEWVRRSESSEKNEQ